MATILGRRVGMIKVVTDAKYGQILGVHMVGHNAQELVHEVLVAMKSELTPKDIGNSFHVHPSLSEGFWEVMRAIDGESIHSFSS
jgi:dihydrolipoamide dehydrogenase